MNKDLVIKDNTLIKASYTLSLTEQRIILLSVAKAQKSKKEINSFKYLSISVDEYCEAFDVDKNGAYQKLKITSELLLRRVFSYRYINSKGQSGVKKSNWVQSVDYIDNQAKIKLLFAHELIPFINQLKDRFTSYLIKDISSMTSIYAIRLYELIIAWKSTHKTPVFEINEFKEMLGLSNEYQTMSNFRKRVLDVAVNQINQHSNIRIKEIPKKKCRTIVGFSFTFEEKAKERKPINQSKENSNSEDKLDYDNYANQILIGVKTGNQYFVDELGIISNEQAREIENASKDGLHAVRVNKANLLVNDGLLKKID